VASAEEDVDMGILNRIRKRAKGTARLAKTVISSVREEGRHPGRPPSHVAQDSPVWKDGEDNPAVKKAQEGIAAAQATAVETDASATPGLPQPVDTAGRDDEPFWFLKDGGEDGWATTNPSEEWRERHGDVKPENYSE
jgi:hypothetical protein